MAPIYAFDFPDWASNFYPSPLVIGGLDYATVEHAFQAAKTTDLDWQERIRTAAGPGDAKHLGQRCPMRPDWEQRRYEVMLDLTRRKFENPSLRYRLISYPEPLVEWNTWHDNIWGICYCRACPGQGQNLLGKALEAVKAELLAQVAS